MNQWQEICDELGFEPPDHDEEYEQLRADWDMSNHPLITPIEERESLEYKTKIAAKRMEKLKLLKDAGYELPR